jgi:hypothetical protein
MGLGSFGNLTIRAAGEGRSEGRDLRKRLNIWEKMAMIEKAGKSVGRGYPESLGGGRIPARRPRVE